MRRAGTTSWQMGEDMSWQLTVALYIRDALGLPAIKPFFIPPVVPAVPEHIPVIGPELDFVPAEQWVLWFSDLLANRMDIPRGASIEYFSLEDRTLEFRDSVERYFAPAVAAADEAFGQFFEGIIKNYGLGMGMTKLVASVEKELRHKAEPFDLQVRILPVEGAWLHRAAPDLVLMSSGARADPEQLRRLLGPIIRELAS